jgi:hypothetical protein
MINPLRNCRDIRRDRVCKTSILLNTGRWRKGAAKRGHVNFIPVLLIFSHVCPLLAIHLFHSESTVIISLFSWALWATALFCFNILHIILMSFFTNTNGILQICQDFLYIVLGDPRHENIDFAFTFVYGCL